MPPGCFLSGTSKRPGSPAPKGTRLSGVDALEKRSKRLLPLPVEVLVMCTNTSIIAWNQSVVKHQFKRG